MISAMTSSLSTILTFPPPGDEASIALQPEFQNENATNNAPQLVLRHGSSLSLMTQVCEFLANPMQNDAFNYIDPTADHHKWARKGMELYYASVVDPTSGSIHCALRAATEGIMEHSRDQKQHKKKVFLIDYVYTTPASRNKGIAGLLVNQVLEMAQHCGASCFVLSVEETAVYWMEKHSFYLCQSPVLNARLNLFPDTHLLRRRAAGESTSDEHDNEEQQDDSSDANSDGQTAFATALNNLLTNETLRSEGMKLCLHSLSLLLKNALLDDSKDGLRRRVRINNPHVHRKVFAVGGDQAMNVLLACGFDLQVDDQGDAILEFRPLEHSLTWLPSAVNQLEQEAMTTGGSM